MEGSSKLGRPPASMAAWLRSKPNKVRNADTEAAAVQVSGTAEGCVSNRVGCNWKRMEGVPEGKPVGGSVAMTNLKAKENERERDEPKETKQTCAA